MKTFVKNIFTGALFIVLLPVFLFLLIQKLFIAKKVEKNVIEGLQKLHFGDRIWLNNAPLKIYEQQTDQFSLFFGYYGLFLDKNRIELCDVLSEESGRKSIRFLNKKRWDIEERDGVIHLTVRK